MPKEGWKEDSLAESKARVIKAVREHALSHYEEGGWDYVVECWDDDDIWQVLSEECRDACDIPSAIIAVGKAVGVLDSIRKDVQGEIF